MVRKANIICPAENFYCAGIVNFDMLALISEASANFGIPHRASKTMYGRREPQTAAAIEVAHG